MTSKPSMTNTMFIQIEPGVYTEDQFRELCDYKVSIYPELGTFSDKSPVDEVNFGITEFEAEDKVTMLMGSSAYVVDQVYIKDKEFFNGPAPVVLLEMISTDPVITVHGNSYTLEDFPEAIDTFAASALWDGKVLDPADDDIFIVRSWEPSPEKKLQFSFNTTPDYFITKATFYKEWKTLKTVYGFTKPDGEYLTLYPFNEEDDFDTVLYRVCMPGENQSPTGQSPGVWRTAEP